MMSREDPREAFVRLAVARTNRILKDLELLGNLSNRSNYSYEPDDVKKVFKAINERVSHISSKFESASLAKKVNEFKL